MVHWIVCKPEKVNIMKYLKDDETGYTTVQELIDILSKIHDPKNTLVVVEENDSCHDITTIAKVNINYRDCIVLSNDGIGVSRPGKSFKNNN